MVEKIHRCKRMISIKGVVDDGEIFRKRRGCDVNVDEKRQNCLTKWKIDGTGIHTSSFSKPLYTWLFLMLLNIHEVVSRGSYS